MLQQWNGYSHSIFRFTDIQHDASFYHCDLSSKLKKKITLTGLSRNSIGKLAPNVESNPLNSIHSMAFRNFDEIIDFHPLQPAETFETYFEIDNQKM